jgi:hypothetical protein
MTWIETTDRLINRYFLKLITGAMMCPSRMNGIGPMRLLFHTGNTFHEMMHFVVVPPSYRCFRVTIQSGKR